MGKPLAIASRGAFIYLKGKGNENHDTQNNSNDFVR